MKEIFIVPNSKRDAYVGFTDWKFAQFAHMISAETPMRCPVINNVKEIGLTEAFEAFVSAFEQLDKEEFIMEGTFLVLIKRDEAEQAFVTEDCDSVALMFYMNNMEGIQIQVFLIPVLHGFEDLDILTDGNFGEVGCRNEEVAE